MLFIRSRSDAPPSSSSMKKAASTSVLSHKLPTADYPYVMMHGLGRKPVPAPCRQLSTVSSDNDYEQPSPAPVVSFEPTYINGRVASREVANERVPDDDDDDDDEAKDYENVVDFRVTLDNVPMQSDRFGHHCYVNVVRTACSTNLLISEKKGSNSSSAV